MVEDDDLLSIQGVKLEKNTLDSIVNVRCYSSDCEKDTYIWFCVCDDIIG